MTRPKNYFLVLSIIILLISSATAQTAAAKLPDTPAGKLVAAYLKAFNSGDDKVMADYFAKHLAKSALEKVPVEDRVKRYRGMYDDLQGLEFQRVLEAESSKIQIVAKTKGGGMVKLSFELESQPPYGQLGLRIEPYE